MYLALLQLMKEDTLYHLIGKRREANEPVHPILYDLYFKMTPLSNISFVSVPLNQTVRMKELETWCVIKWLHLRHLLSDGYKA